jgi:hypothetical protein
MALCSFRTPVFRRLRRVGVAPLSHRRVRCVRRCVNKGSDPQRPPVRRPKKSGTQRAMDDLDIVFYKASAIFIATTIVLVLVLLRYGDTGNDGRAWRARGLFIDELSLSLPHAC